MNIIALDALASTCPQWVLQHPDGSRYLTRTVLAGDDCLNNHNGAPVHMFLHDIHTADGDRHLHNHPWRWSVAVILSGGYTERRRLWGIELRNTYAVGDVNILRPGDYHSIISVLPDTRTLFIAGAEVNDWGFWVDGIHVPHDEYMRRSDAQAMTVEPLR